MEPWIWFFLTLLIELPLVYIFFRHERKFALLTGFLLNLFTWPLLHIFIFYTDIHINILEFAVAVTESIGYYIVMNCKWRKAIALAFLANIVSYGCGLLLNKFL
jgi:hypothetical protein